MNLEKVKKKKMPCYKETEELEGQGIDFLVREYREIRLGGWEGS